MFDSGVHLVILDGISDVFRIIFRIFTSECIWDGICDAFRIFELEKKKLMQGPWRTLNSLFQLIILRILQFDSNI